MSISNSSPLPLSQPEASVTYNVYVPATSPIMSCEFSCPKGITPPSVAAQLNSYGGNPPCIDAVKAALSPEHERYSKYSMVTSSSLISSILIVSNIHSLLSVT